MLTIVSHTFVTINLMLITMIAIRINVIVSIGIPPFFRNRRDIYKKEAKKRILKLTSLKKVFLEEDTRLSHLSCIVVMHSDYNMILTYFVEYCNNIIRPLRFYFFCKKNKPSDLKCQREKLNYITKFISNFIANYIFKIRNIIYNEFYI